ncbi:MAG TPA: response regulator, partial [Gallionellaceae bacterium]|nr:response regulator [Gallionellaceae bacterium]
LTAEPIAPAREAVSLEKILPATEEQSSPEPEKPKTKVPTSAVEMPIKPPLEAGQKIAAPDEAHQESSQEAAQRVRQYVEERAVRDEIDKQLLPIFLEETNDLQPQIGKTLRAWRENPDDARLSNELQRGLHTLKGSARMAGAMRLGELTHRMEDRVIAGMSKVLRGEALWDELDSYFDRISSALERLRSGATELEEPAVAAAQPEQPATAAAQPEAAEPQPQAAQSKAETPAERAAAAMLRVRSETVDRLVNEAGEISVARSRMETELRAFKTGLSDMTESVIRLRRQLREIEIQAESQMEARVALAQDMAEKFDPLEFDRFTRFQELTRFMGESVHDVQTVQQTLMKNLDETAAAMSAQAYLNRELQQSLMAIRMVPFAGISDRLYRIVRQTSKELHKRANLDLKGTEVELDRSVLDKMTAPFEHILRNAIAHGLESPEERNRKGKLPIGQIQIALSQESNEVVFDIIDDGAGINLDSLRQKAVEHGLVPTGTKISDEDAMQMIFNSGISTATEVTEISGRGVGMDVVRNEITGLGGQISVRSERGKGTRFTIRLPLTLAVTQVLMTRAGHEQYAIPSVMVEQVLHIKSTAMEEAHHAGLVEWQGKAYPLKYLPHLLGDEKHVPENHMRNSVLLLQSAEQRVALHVDELLGNQETVVKNIGPQLARLPGIAGATVLGNGRVVLILNPVALAQPTIVVHKDAAQPVEKAARAVEAPQLQTMPLVMVVDDSLTVRKVTTRMLTRAGYEVATAKDGVDALEQLTQITPDVMLLDVEMPRMDGFELTRAIRRDPKLHKLPILMITSRTAEKHRDYALELGVNAYFGKPFQEEELLQQIAVFINKPGR